MTSRWATPLLLVLLAAPAASAAIYATGLDAITTPGVPVDIRAKFESTGFWYFRPDVTDQPVAFSSAGSHLGVSLSDDDGVASLRIVAQGTGVASFDASLTSDPGSPASARVFVLDPARPAAVVDIDGTLSDMEDWRVPFEGHEADAFPHSPEVLRELARTHDIIYLTARDDAFDAVTRAFLARHGFPDGPVIYNDLGLTSVDELLQLIPGNHGEFKLEAIRELQRRGVNVAVGIGNAETDAYAYENAGLKSYINTSEVGTGPSFRFTDYQILRLQLVADGILP